MNRRSNVLNGFGGRSVNEVSSPSSDGWSGWMQRCRLSSSRPGRKMEEATYVGPRRLSLHRQITNGAGENESVNFLICK